MMSTDQGIYPEAFTPKRDAVYSVPNVVKDGHRLPPNAPTSRQNQHRSSATNISNVKKVNAELESRGDQSDSTSDAAARLSAPKSLIAEPQKPVFDVYAKPYIPSGLRGINQETPDSVIITESRHEIDFGQYIRSFAGTGFVSHERNVDYNIEHNTSSPMLELTEQSYARYLVRLLRQETAAKQVQNLQYALYGVALQSLPKTNTPQLWALVVPGLREDSPLVEMGDTLQVRQLWTDWQGHPVQMAVAMKNGYGMSVFHQAWTWKQYNACVYSVNRKEEIVYLRVDGLQQLKTPQAPSILPMAVNVVFPVKQAVLQCQHRALASIGQSLKACDESTSHVECLSEYSQSVSRNVQTSARTDWIRRMLFPTDKDGRLQTNLRGVPHRALFDHAVNYEQAHAVNSICIADYGTLPYLISGPPGTGKTKTLVEVAMQLLNTTDTIHLLICAPSEAAADTLALRLKQYLTPRQLFRLNRPNRADNEVPRELLQHCYMQDDMFYLPPFKTLLAFSVVVTSCRDAAILAEARLTNTDLWSMERDLMSALHPEADPPTPSLHWGALLVDEAAQATEVDVLPAISVISPPSAYPQHCVQPRFVMAGDEHQLGPRTASHDPAYSTSLFARLFKRPVYTNHPLSRSNAKPSSAPVLKRSMLPILYPPFTNLIRNYRSHPSILSIPSTLFYNDTLLPESATPNTPLQSSPLWRGRKWPVLFIPHTAPDDLERDNGGWYNVSEARLACSMAVTFLHAGVAQADICIMSPFAAQVKLLRQLIRSTAFGLWDVNIGPVEAFQGLERRVVVLCTTRTRERFVAQDVERGVGLVRQARRMNVALTRAREALVVLGSPGVLGLDDGWRAWTAFCERNGLVDDRMGVGLRDGTGLGPRGSKGIDESENVKIGVLERALIARDEGMREAMWPALGAAAAAHCDVNGEEYDAWTTSLRLALDEERTSSEDESETLPSSLDAEPT